MELQASVSKQVVGKDGRTGGTGIKGINLQAGVIFIDLDVVQGCGSG